ncbi:hypothetical protein V8G54_015178 [Vigna mungo]|uniref:SCP domain-containing protein n=1 Tax=Vigna mungo TaxID=3915 RepID=A0AAQ3NKP8_VIGMU
MSPWHVIVAIVLLLCATRLTLAQNTPQDYLEVHNQARAEVGVGPLSWNHTLQAYAQRYANERIPDCNLEHSMGPYGENLAEGYGEMKGSDAVKFWLTEKPDYDYGSNRCVHDECGHYTQIVWRNSIHLGCARAKCNNAILHQETMKENDLIDSLSYQYLIPRRIVLVFVIIGNVANSQDSPTDYLNGHNAARSEVGVENIVWNDTVAAFAQNYANQRCFSGTRVSRPVFPGKVGDQLCQQQSSEVQKVEVRWHTENGRTFLVEAVFKYERGNDSGVVLILIFRENTFSYRERLLMRGNGRRSAVIRIDDRCSTNLGWQLISRSSYYTTLGARDDRATGSYSPDSVLVVAEDTLEANLEDVLEDAVQAEQTVEAIPENFVGPSGH